MRSKGSAEELANRRRLAVTRVREGWDPADVAAFLGVTLRSVQRWLAAARDRGDRAGLNPKPHLGPRPRLSIEQDIEILACLDGPATWCGFPTPLWTAPRVAALIEKRFGVHFHPRYINRWLRDRGITPQKPRRKAREQDPEAVRLWLEQRWPRLWLEAEQAGDWLVFLDESGLQLDPVWRRTQAPRGRPPAFAVPKAHRRKVSVVAALAWCPSRGEVRLLYQTLADGYFDAPKVAAFLGGLPGQLGGKATVLWDRGPMHKGPAIRAAVADSGDRLRTVFQPAYTPEANPVEQVWGWLKYGRLSNVVAHGVLHLEALVQAELDLAGEWPELLQGLFHGSALALPTNMTQPTAMNMKLAG